MVKRKTMTYILHIDFNGNYRFSKSPGTHWAERNDNIYKAIGYTASDGNHSSPEFSYYIHTRKYSKATAHRLLIAHAIKELDQIMITSSKLKQKLRLKYAS